MDIFYIVLLIFSGIGIVNVIEVVNVFLEEDGFYKFREWIELFDLTILGKVVV